MALNIKNPEADRLARELAALTGESISRTVIEALRERIAAHRGKVPRSRRVVLQEIRERAGTMARTDARSDDELLGYDDGGLLS